jgi:predicted DNA-binding ribbon-helix-helix protein
MPTKIDYLSTYLQDHRAGAGMGSDLVVRLRDENVGTPYEDFLTLLAQQIEEDVATLESLMERFGVDKSIVKTAGAKVAETFGRLKPNEHLASYSPLSRVLELEGLRSGVQGKLALWDALREISDEDDRLDPAELLALVERAEAQLSGLREHHRMASHDAFGA